MKKKIIIISVTLYSVLILRLIVFKYPPGMTFSIANANFIPFKTILGYLAGEPTWKIAIRNLLGNIILFVPVGFLFAVIFKELSGKRILFAGIVIGVIFEVLQIVFKSGIFDIDDIILNSLGVIIGYLIFITLVKFYDVFK